MKSLAEKIERAFNPEPDISPVIKEEVHPPQLLTDLTELPPPILILPDTNEKEHQAIDLVLTNQNLQRVHQLWDTPDMSIRDACLLIDKTHDIIKARRDVLNRQYGYQSDGSGRGKIPIID